MHASLRSSPQPATANAIWELLAPAVPDCLKHLGDNCYQASWWKPVPMMDVEIVQRTAGIQLLDEPYEPDHLSGGLVLRFHVLTQP